MGRKPKQLPPPPPPSGPPEQEITCVGCKTSIKLSDYKNIRKRLYVFGPDGFGIFEILPFCSFECWDEHMTPTKKRVRELWARCHRGANGDVQCGRVGEYTCKFSCCKCRACEDHKSESMVRVRQGPSLQEILRRAG